MTRALLLLLLFQTRSAQGGFGDTVGPVDKCPAFTTCPAVCVQSVEDCSQRCRNGTSLCVDGHCRADCQSIPTSSNPCEPSHLNAHHRCSIFKVACPRTNANYDVCLDRYKFEYAQYDLCAQRERDVHRQVHTVDYTETPFLALMIGLTLVTVGLVAHTRLQKEAHQKHRYPLAASDDQRQFCQPYRETIVGTILYYAVVATIWAFQLVFFVLVLLYYVNQGAITVIEAMWKEERQILLVFEIVWFVGIVWNLAIKWPPKLRALCGQPCDPMNATYVAVWTPNSAPHGMVASDKYVAMLRRILHVTLATINTNMAKLFSQDVELHGGAAGGQWTYCPVRQEDYRKYFVHNFRRYNLEGDTFVPGTLQGHPEQVLTIQQFYEQGKVGLNTGQVLERRALVGPNTIHMDKPTFWQVMQQEFTQPYYTYQNFIMWSWMPLYYYYMAVVQTAVIVTGGITVCIFRYRNEKSLYQLTHMEGTVHVLRDGAYVELSHADLVPGDVVLVEPGRTYCDMVLVSSQGVLVDESALTGESTPVAKTAVDPAEGNTVYGSKPSHAKRSTIQAGTTVLESEAGHNLAMVLNTGSFTTKGELLRDIFSYQRHQFKFDVEVGIVVFILCIYAVFVFIAVLIMLNYAPVYGWFYGMYAVASVLPPLLPTVFTVSVGVSDNRLAKKRIACTNSEEILVAGKVKRAFFDKTGTLTKQGLEFISSQSRENWKNEVSLDGKPSSKELAMGMAVCHSLTRSSAGDLIGNPVDLAMFAAANAHLESVRGETTSAGTAPIRVTDCFGQSATIVKHFDFDHHRMTQSVIVKTGDNHLVAFVKGSGESMQRVCRAETMPTDFTTALRAHAKQGIYQISMGIKVLDASLESDLAHVARDAIEDSVTFVGVINFKNVIREETPGVIRELENGEVKCVMVTGDSVLTGVCIAKESGIILPERQVLLGMEIDDYGMISWLNDDDKPASLPESLSASNVDLALAGSVWDTLLIKFPDQAMALADHVRVFGRCTPVDKVSVVTYFIDRGFITLMCGDGGNDCGALKTAHVGIALSDAEASIVSPFTSLDKTISSVVEVLREGRCALASALASYKFMILYGHLGVAAQVVGSLFRTTLTEWCWVFMDGIWPISLGFTLPLSNAAYKLAPSRPTSSLLGLQTMASAVGVLFIHYFFLLVAFATLFGQDWFQCRKWNGKDISNVLIIGDNYESQVIFLVIGYQFVSSAMSYNFGYEFRASWFLNHWFVGVVVFFTLLHFYITLVPGTLSCVFRVNCRNENVVRSVSTFSAYPIQNFWNTTEMPSSFAVTLIVFMILNSATVVVWEYFGVNGTRKRYARKHREEPRLFKATSSEVLEGTV